MNPLALVLALASVVLPGVAPIGMDYLAYDAANHRVWVPAGSSGNVDVVDTATGKVTPIGGFVTIASTRPGRPKMGPSSATVGDGVAWVGNRGDNTICSFDLRTLEKRTCVQLRAMPDGIQYVSSTHELWVTTPSTRELVVVDVAAKVPAVTTSIKVAGAPEGYAVDVEHGVFYTNLEDKDTTVSIDVKTRKQLGSWPSGCGGDGPRGIVIDAPRKQLFVACTDGAVTQDLAHGGKVLGRVKTGAGVDNIDYFASRKLLYVASRVDGMLAFVDVAVSGALSVRATLPTAAGARNAVVDSNGTAYVADSTGGRLIVVNAPAAK